MPGREPAALLEHAVDDAVEIGERAFRDGDRLVGADAELAPLTFELCQQLAATGENGAAAGAELAVRYAQCVVPDTFRDVPGMDVGVTVEGKVAPDGAFDATTGDPPGSMSTPGWNGWNGSALPT